MVSVDLNKFDHFNNMFIGVDRIFDQLTNTTNNITTRAVNNYPPYNIVKAGDDDYVIEMAVAGHTMDSINVTVEKQVLEIEGKGIEKTNADYIHQGISSRSFKRSFTLADTVKVKGANIVNGILYVELENEIPEEMKPKKIKIGASKPQLLLEKNKQ